MCGIAGLWLKEQDGLEKAISLMSNQLRHRGPDMEGVWINYNCGLGLAHTRLSILDLSEAGRQPMVSKTGRFVMVFNGEIYNHLEIRRKLGPGIRWLGGSDTETLLEAVEHWGIPAVLSKIVGMFAIAVWDQVTQQVSLFRDRLGEKPLYISKVEGGIAFASEIKSIAACFGFSRKVDKNTLKQFLYFGFPFGRSTIYEDIKSLEPGVLYTFSSAQGEAQTYKYWVIDKGAFDFNGRFKENDLVDEVENLLTEVVKSQMEADVPVGAFLSGGIDSSLVAALMQKVSGRRVRTFTMGLESGPNSEIEMGRSIAKQLGTDHTEIIVNPSEMLEVVPRLAEIYDEPFGDPSQLPTVLLCQKVKQSVVVALSGDGGDEMFGGYNRYLALDRMAPIIGKTPVMVRRMLSIAINLVSADNWNNLSLFGNSVGCRKIPIELGEKMYKISRILRLNDPRDIYLETLCNWRNHQDIKECWDLCRLLLQPYSGELSVESMMRWDACNYLPNNILCKVDRAAMSVGLETRLPLLDQRIVEMANRIPMEYKIRNGQTKWILRSIVSRQIGVSTFDRAKQGFTLPIGQWMRGPLKDWCFSILNDESSGLLDILDQKSVLKLWRDHCDGVRNNQKALWSVIILKSWLLKNKIV
jgi:asparagine synthase (glutamine-hydrolysing)